MKYLFYLTQITLLFSCNSIETSELIINTNNFKVVSIPSKNEDFKNITDILTLKDFIILKPNTAQPLSNLSDYSSIKRIYIIDSLIYILDLKYMTANTYDKKGNYLRTINKIGNSKGGSTFLLDLVYNKSSQNLFIISNIPNKIMNFNMEGTLIGEFQPSFYGSSMICIDSSYFFDLNFSSTKETGKLNLIQTDNNFNITSKSFSYTTNNNEESYLFNGGLFANNDSGFYYSPGLTNNIYSLNKTEIKALYHFRFETDIPFNPNSLYYPDQVNKYKNQMQNQLYFYKDNIGVNFYNTNKNTTQFILYNKRYNTFYKAKDNALFDNASIYESSGKLILCTNAKKVSKLLDSNLNKIDNVLATSITKKLRGDSFKEEALCILVFEIIR